MPSAWDDFPIHQTSGLFTRTSGGEPGRYDRYWFTAFDSELNWHLAFAMGIYPNTGIIDAAFSVVNNGIQESVFASDRLGIDRATVVGPIRLEVSEPQKTIRLIVDEHEGLSADLTFHGTTEVIAEGPLIRYDEHGLITDRTRTEQLGRWSGSFTSHEKTVECSRTGWLGARDRSWGVRALHSPGGRARAINFSWALLHFDDECIFAAVNEDILGRREARTGAALQHLPPESPTYGVELGTLYSDEFEFDVQYRRGTRQAESATLRFGPRGLIDRRIEIRPVSSFQMKGLGYSHPKWKHGTDHGGLAVGRERWRIDELDATQPENTHAGQICLIKRGDGADGVGYFDHIAVGAHLPSGLEDN